MSSWEIDGLDAAIDRGKAIPQKFLKKMYGNLQRSWLWRLGWRTKWDGILEDEWVLDKCRVGLVDAGDGAYSFNFSSSRALNTLVRLFLNSAGQGSRLTLHNIGEISEMEKYAKRM